MRKCVISLFAAALLAGAAHADDDLIGLMRHDLRLQKQAFMEVSMELTPEEAKTFWPIYREYLSEYELIGDQQVELLMEFGESKGQLTNERTREMVEISLDLDQQVLTLRKRYYEWMSTELTDIIAARFLQVDNQITLLAQFKLANDLPLIKAPE
jgi:hypothetical protein